MNDSDFQIVKSDADLYLDASTSYSKLKIEKLGNEAFNQVLSMFKKGYSYEKIAKELSQIHDTNIKGIDVSKVLDKNAKLMTEYRAFTHTYNLERANLLLDETTVFVDEMEKMKDASELLHTMLKNGTNDPKRAVDLAKGLSDITKTTLDIVKGYKKMTGQYKEGPSIMIDNSRKEVNITNNSTNIDAKNKLLKQLGRANFNIKVDEEKTLTHNKSNSDIIDVDFEDDEESIDVELNETEE